jgi:hypothetical protein
MTPDYQKVWSTLNELEMVTSKISSAREILDSAVDRLQEHQYDKAETLLYAADEFLQYYLEDFDRKFKDAWKETVVKLKEEDPCMPPWGHSDLEYGLANPTLTEDRNSNFPGENTICDKEDPSPECKGAWTSFWEETYYPKEHSNYYYEYDRNESDRPNPFDKVVKWRLPVEEVKDSDTDETEYFITFPDDLLESTNLKPGDEVEWVDQNDGNFLLRKVTKPLEGDEC